MKKFMIINVLSVLAVVIYMLISKPAPRELTYYENNQLYCLTGITTENTGVLQYDLFGIVNVYIAWKDGFPRDYSAKLSSGSILMITWEPYLEDFDEKTILYDIAEGRYDGMILEFAREVKEYRNPCLIRWGHEMNGNWYPWCGTEYEENPEIYRKAYIRIHDIFVSAECDNAAFVFSINNEDVPAERWNRFERYYPGSEYVDFTGIDAYNWGTSKKWGKWFWMRSRWRSAEKILHKPYERLIKLAPDKPIIITEIASASAGGDKNKWVENFLEIIKNKFKAVKGFVWFDIDKESDWAITGDQGLFGTYRSSADDAYFRTGYRNLEIYDNER